MLNQGLTEYILNIAREHIINAKIYMKSHTNRLLSSS